MTDKTPAQLADQAADAIRAINHLTLGPRDGFQYPGDVYSLVAGLSQLARMLPQALEQTSRLIADLAEAGRLRSDRNELEHDLRETYLGLESARVAAESLYAGLNRVHSGLGPIGYKE
ncbi:hypothetical protein ACFWV1_26445 [Streptomyces sp. NPDC058700]|uniref:hypothetical protein n=1 Tax=Streptomyces sp. NPDC058700 TaxID=3346607 RepID=UPI003659A108